MNAANWRAEAIKFWLSVALRGFVIGLWIGVLICLGAAGQRIATAGAETPAIVQDDCGPWYSPDVGSAWFWVGQAVHQAACDEIHRRQAEVPR